MAGHRGRRGARPPVALRPAGLGLGLALALWTPALAGCSDGGPTAASDPQATARDTVVLLFEDEETASSELVLFGVADSGVHRLRSRVVKRPEQTSTGNLAVLGFGVDRDGREVFTSLGGDSLTALRVSDLETVWSGTRARPAASSGASGSRTIRGWPRWGTAAGPTVA